MASIAAATTSSDVTFAALTDADIEWYLGTGEPFDKAGAYALQGAGGVFVRRCRGSVSGVLGLPLHETSALLGNWGSIVSDPDTEFPRIAVTRIFPRSGTSVSTLGSGC